MARIGLPVPPGFTITTEECLHVLRESSGQSARLYGEVRSALSHIESATGNRFGDSDDPLLVSVRSGARVSMPGMLDSILNLGPNVQTVIGLAALSGDERFAWDSYRRFVQMFASVVLGIDHALFEDAPENVARRTRVKEKARGLRWQGRQIRSGVAVWSTI